MQALEVNFTKTAPHHADIRIGSDKLPYVDKAKILGHQFKSYCDAVGKCNLEYLKDRRETHCKKFAQGLGDNVRTCHLLPPSKFQSHGRNLRNSSNLSQYRMKTSRFRNSPVPYFVSLLNKT